METVIITTEVASNNADEIMNQDFSNQIEHYTQLIYTYGASTVIIAVFLLMLFLILLYILKNNQKTNNQLINQQQELVDMLLDSKKSNNDTNIKKVVKEPDIVEIFLNINSSIKEILKDISA